MRCFEPEKMAALISFLFNQEILQGELKLLWCSHLDEHYVRDKIIDPLIHNISNAQQLEHELKRLAANGMEIQKVKKNTISDPFLLTVPKPRKLPQPTVIIPTGTKVLEKWSNDFRLDQYPKHFSKLQN